jgi:hypothetical protein
MSILESGIGILELESWNPPSWKVPGGLYVNQPKKQTPPVPFWECCAPGRNAPVPAQRVGWAQLSKLIAIWNLKSSPWKIRRGLSINYDPNLATLCRSGRLCVSHSLWLGAQLSRSPKPLPFFPSRAQRGLKASIWDVRASPLLYYHQNLATLCGSAWARSATVGGTAVKVPELIKVRAGPPFAIAKASELVPGCGVAASLFTRSAHFPFPPKSVILELNFLGLVGFFSDPWVSGWVWVWV